jgi:hypothetical protein
MACDKIRPNDAVAVEKYAICSARGQYRLIANLSGAKAAIGVPHVLNAVADSCLPVFDQACSGPSVCRASDRKTASSASSRL